MELQWFLIVGIYGCINGLGADPGMIPGNCAFHPERVRMPSLETCRSVRDLNNNERGGEHFRCIIAEVIIYPPRQGTTTK